MKTIIDVAKHAQVSTATVSLVIRNKGRISDKTRQRVLNSIEELGYVYNQTAANLRNQKSSQIGLLIHDISNPFYASMIEGASECLEKESIMLFLANAKEDLDKQTRFIDSLLQQNAAGLLLTPAKNTNEDYLRTVERRGLPIVLTFREPEQHYFDFVGTNNFLGVQHAMKHFLKHEHTNIAFIGGMPYSTTRSHRLGGYMSTLIEHGVTPNQNYILACGSSFHEGFEATKQLLKQSPEVTAIFAYQDIIAFGVMKAIESMGLTVGNDIAVIGFDDVTEAKYAYPKLTTVSASAKETGEKAASILINRINGDKSPPRSYIIPPKLIVRESCGVQIKEEITKV